jgi:hypothetical protein
MTLSRLLTTLTLTAALMSLAGETVGDAQIFRNSAVADAPGLPVGIEKNGIVWQFKTASGGSHAPTILGILTPPQSEPLLSSQSGALWVWCAGPSDDYFCALKVNVFGEAIELSTWSGSLQ